MRAETITIPVKKLHLQHWLAVLFMFACLFFAWWFTPQEKWFNYLGKPQFEQIIPQNFAGWTQVVDGNGTLIINPEQQEALNYIYTQTLTRTYEQISTGRRLMLSLAYSDDQKDSTKLHFPETCYSAQGFNVQSMHRDQILANHRAIEVMRMTAQMRDRVEQVSYFVRIGNKILDRRLILLRLDMALKGYIADGLLFRISEISNDAKSSNQLQDLFVNDLLKTLSPSQQTMLIGQD